MTEQASEKRPLAPNNADAEGVTAAPGSLIVYPSDLRETFPDMRGFSPLLGPQATLEP